MFNLLDSLGIDADTPATESLDALRSFTPERENDQIDFPSGHQPYPDPLTRLLALEDYEIEHYGHSNRFDPTYKD